MQSIISYQIPATKSSKTRQNENRNCWDASREHWRQLNETTAHWWWVFHFHVWLHCYISLSWRVLISDKDRPSCPTLGTTSNGRDRNAGSVESSILQTGIWQTLSFRVEQSSADASFCLRISETSKTLFKKGDSITESDSRWHYWQCQKRWC